MLPLGPTAPGVPAGPGGPRGPGKPGAPAIPGAPCRVHQRVSVMYLLVKRNENTSNDRFLTNIYLNKSYLQGRP